MPLERPPIKTMVTMPNGVVSPLWHRWFDRVFNLLRPINNDKSYSPPALNDIDAEVNSVYYSNDSGKLVYKDSGGTVNDLY